MAKKPQKKEPNMQAVDYPPTGDDPLNCYPHGPVTTFGDALFEACTIPAGWHPEVVNQPAHGSVDLSSFPEGWQFDMSNPPTINTEDSFTYRLTDGTNTSNTATVRLNMAVEV